MFGSGGGGGAGGDAGTAAILEQIMGGDLPSEGAVSLAVDVPAEDRMLGSIQLFPFEAGVFCFELCPANMRIAVSSSANTVAIYQFDPRPAMLLGYDPLDPRVDDSSRTGRVFLPQVQVFHGHSDSVHEIVTLGDAEDRLIATCAADNKVAVYDAATTHRIAALDFTASALCLAVARTPEAGAVLLAGGTDYVIRAYTGDPGRHTALARSLYEESVRGGRHGEIAPEAFELARFEGHAGRVQTLAVNASSTLMVSGAHDFCILLWDLSKVRLAPAAPGAAREAGVPRVAPVSRIDAHMGHVTSLCFCDASVSGGNLLASGGNDHAVKVWNVTKGALGGASLTLKWSGQDSGDESRFSATPGEGTSSLVSSGPAPHRSTVSAVQWGRGPSSSLLFSAAWDHSTCVWAADSSKGDATMPLVTRSLHTARITDMDISADGMYLVTVSADFSARQWTATRDLRPVARFPCTALDGGMTSVAAGRRQFFTASENGQIRVFPLFNPADPAVAKTFRAVEDKAQAAEAQGSGSVVLDTHQQQAGAAASAAGAGTGSHAFVSSNPIGPVGKPLMASTE
jgi:WD40 repeat protein